MSRRDLQVQDAETSDGLPGWYNAVPQSSGRITFVGYLIFSIGIVGFGGWAATAPIEGAIVARGTFVATGQNKVVQHLEGGIISSILVREGDIVNEGQTIVRLDDTAARSELRRLRLREHELLAQSIRLRAEKSLAAELEFSSELTNTDLGEDTAATLAVQTEVFTSRQRKLAREVAILEQLVLSLQHKIGGDEARLAATRAQMEIIGRELEGKAELHRAGLVRTPEYFSVLRAAENARGQIGQLIASVNDSQAKIAGAQHQIEEARDVHRQRAAEELRTTRAELKDIRERMKASQSVLDRIEVKAPVRGVVYKMNYHTPGGVVRPGNDILAILPTDNDLLIEARVRPQDINNLQDGQLAAIRLTAMSQRVTPMIDGNVVYVSADAIPDEASGSRDNSYVVRVALDPAQATALREFNATPGMPAEVYIKTSDRTFLQYLVQPIYDTMQRAFREA